MKQIFEMELHHRGAKEVYHTPVCLKGTSASVMLPVAAAIRTKMYSRMLQFFKMLCVVFPEETAKLYDRNGSQFAKIFYVIADTVD